MDRIPYTSCLEPLIGTNVVAFWSSGLTAVTLGSVKMSLGSGVAAEAVVLGSRDARKWLLLGSGCCLEAVVARKQLLLGSGCCLEAETQAMKCSEAQCVRWIRTGLDWHHADDRQCASLQNEGSAGWSNPGFACVDLRLTRNGSLHAPSIAGSMLSLDDCCSSLNTWKEVRRSGSEQVTDHVHTNQN